MVHTILEVRKTMTRRTKGLEKINEAPDEWILSPVKKTICRLFEGVNPNPLKTYLTFENINTNEQIEILCPYGEVRDEQSMSDVIWVRESFYAFGQWQKNGLSKSGKQKWKFVQDSKFKEIRYIDNPPFKVEKNTNRAIGWYKRPSLFMPFTACRIFLRITNIRVERLNDIPEEDAKLEGVMEIPVCNPGNPLDNIRYRDYRFQEQDNQRARYWITAKRSFETLWAKINGYQSWYANPWVWVISFERCEKPTA
jgi:hypothetical protein